MADVTTPSAAVVSGADKKVKPEKPDEDAYKINLAKAEKEHAFAMENLVSPLLVFSFNAFFVAYYS